VQDSFLIPALDFSSLDEIEKVIGELSSRINIYKVGMQSFFATHGKVVELLKKNQKQVFLDLKLNDIPNTIEFAVTELIKKYEPRYLSLFCGDISAINKARNQIEKMNSSTKLISITRLTSDEQKSFTTNEVISITKEKIEAGSHGIVCSGLETQAIRDEFGDEIVIINPGVRLPQDSLDDQKRVVTPSQALLAGANHIVVGRPIMQAKNKQQAVDRFIENWQSS